MGSSSDKRGLMAELCHQINSPLAAMRNALYLASGRTQDPALLHYLALANEEITTVAVILRETRCLVESMAREEGCPPRACTVFAGAAADAVFAAPITGKAA